MKNLLKAASGIFATIPGIGVLTSGAMAPPDYSKLFGAFIEIVGVGSLLLVLLNQKSWTKTTAARSRLAITSGLSALALLLAYVIIFNTCVIKVEQRGMTYFPLLTSGELKKLIAQEGSRAAVVEKVGEAGAYDLVQRQPLSARLITTAILILLICATTSGLVVCFGSLAANVKAKNLTVNDRSPPSKAAAK